MPTKKNNLDTSSTNSYLDKQGKARINEIMSNFELDSAKTEEQPSNNVLGNDELDIEMESVSPDYKSYMSKLLSEDNPNELQQDADMDIDIKEESDVIVTKPILEEDVDNQEIEVIDIQETKVEDNITEEVAHLTSKYDDDKYADIDNDYIRPLKLAREEKVISAVGQQNVSKQEAKTNLKETKSQKQAKLAFTPKAAKEYTKIRKKYKIDKDSIFSENDYVDGFILAKGEMLLRRYDALKVNGGNVGRILVTNKRMLFNTSEKAEVPIDSVCGIRSAKYWKISWAKLIFSIIFLGVAAFAFIYDFTNFEFFDTKKWLIYVILAAGGIFALIGAIFLFSFARRRFALKIFVKSALEFITYNSKRRKKESAVIESLIVAMPGKHIEKFVREIGALVLQSKDGYFD